MTKILPASADHTPLETDDFRPSWLFAFAGMRIRQSSLGVNYKKPKANTQIDNNVN